MYVFFSGEVTASYQLASPSWLDENFNMNLFCTVGDIYITQSIKFALMAGLEL